MELANLEYIFRNFSKSWGIPISIYVDGHLYRKFERKSFDVDLIEKHRFQLESTTKSFEVLLTKQLLLYAMISIKDSNIKIIAGPGRSVQLEDEDIRSLLKDNDISIQKFPQFRDYIQSIRLLPIDQLVNDFSVLNAAINQEIVVIDMFDIDSFMTDKEVDRNELRDLIEQQYNDFNAYDPLPHFDFELKLLYYIRYGLTDKLERHLSSFISRPTSFTADAFRQFKDRCISSTTLVSREAIKGGLPIDISYSLFDSYCRRIERSNSIQQLTETSVSMFFDYAKRIQEIQNIQTNNPSINRVVKYIMSHLNSKLSVSIIAKQLNMNSGYLSYLFKKETGTSLSYFINQQKVNDAKRLLRFTDKSLGEIANDLAFTTQSYFQNVFRRHCNITPMEYKLQSSKND